MHRKFYLILILAFINSIFLFNSIAFAAVTQTKAELKVNPPPLAKTVSRSSPTTTSPVIANPKPVPSISPGVPKYQNVSRPLTTTEAGPKIPKWNAQNPEWSVTLNASLAALGGNALIPQQGNNQASAFSLGLEYQPLFIQDYGILSFGPKFSFYPIFSSAVAPTLDSIYSLGAQFHYQLHYFSAQWIVPVASVSVEWLNYHLNTLNSAASDERLKGSSLFMLTPSAGLWILLNAIDGLSSQDWHNATGIRRFYLITELRFFTGTDSTKIFQVKSGRSFHFGLRAEF